MPLEYLYKSYEEQTQAPYKKLTVSHIDQCPLYTQSRNDSDLQTQSFHNISAPKRSIPR